MTNSGPSRTALVVAAGVVYAAGDPNLRELVDPDAGTLVRTMLQSARPRLLTLVDSPIGRRMIRLAERWTIPGIIRHWNCRKQWLGQVWDTARQDRFDTLVILGSGFDALSLRAAQKGNGLLRAIDVDHPATLTARRMALEQVNWLTHSFIAHDLSKPGVGQALEPLIHADGSVFVVIEGVLMYLEPQRVSSLFGELVRMKARRVRIAFSFMETSGHSAPAFRPRSRMVDLWLRMRGEPFLSGLDPAMLSTWLKDLGFRLISFAHSPEKPNAGIERLRGECVALAERIEDSQGDPRKNSAVAE